MQLDAAERMHLFDLARSAQPMATPRRRRPATQPIRASVRHILDAITAAAAVVRNDRLDVLAANALGYALYSEMFAGPTRPANGARCICLDPRARDFYLDWNKAASDSVAVLRAYQAVSPPGRRRAHPHLRPAGSRRRSRTDAVHVHRRARLARRAVTAWTGASR